MHPLLAQAVATLQLPKDQAAALWQFCLCYQHWQASSRLTGATTMAKFISDHLLDSLSALPRLRGLRVLDLGTGCGLPGLPLAITASDRHFTLVDRSARKLGFARYAASRLKLQNLCIRQQNADDIRETFDTVIARALAPPAKSLALAAPRLASTGRIILMQPEGRIPPQGWSTPEIDLLPPRLPAHEGHTPTNHCLWLYDAPCVQAAAKI